MAAAYILVGNTGAGKSTYAARLAKRLRAHVFANDEWMRTLFFPDMPDPPDYEWALERTQRIERQVCAEALKLMALDVDVILDLGFFAKEQRDRVLSFFTEKDAPAEMHYLDVDKTTRWARVEERNRGLSDTFQFEVDRETFDFCETIFEPLDEDERARSVIVDAS